MDFEERKTLYNIRKTVIQMLEDRHYTVPESEKINLTEITKIVHKNFDLSPSGLIKSLNLLKPIYSKTSCYGHFGREDAGFSWENPEMF